MSSSLIEIPTHAGATTLLGADEDRANSERSSSPWRWMVLACLLLGVSGGIRFWRDHQFARLTDEDKTCPFPLAEMPKSLGTWRAVEDSDMKLDPEIARVAGSTDHVIRTYADSKTGEKVQVLMLYGLADDVFGHTPEVCYPATGQQPATQPRDKSLPAFPPDKVRFRSQIFISQMGPKESYHYSEVCYSFRHGGRWKPDMGGEWKKFRYEPGMFKIQTSREVSAAAANPDATKSTVSESLVTELVKELERRIAEKAKKAKSAEARG